MQWSWRPDCWAWPFQAASMKARECIAAPGPLSIPSLTIGPIGIPATIAHHPTDGIETIATAMPGVVIETIIGIPATSVHHPTDGIETTARTMSGPGLETTVGIPATGDRIRRSRTAGRPNGSHATGNIRNFDSLAVVIGGRRRNEHARTFELRNRRPSSCGEDHARRQRGFLARCCREQAAQIRRGKLWPDASEAERPAPKRCQGRPFARPQEGQQKTRLAPKRENLMKSNRRKSRWCP